jgi:hypothetical protein
VPFVVNALTNRPQTPSNNEFEFLCTLATTDLSPERRARIANWNLSSFDWPKFTSQAEHHGVLPLAARNLLEIDSASPNPRLPKEVARDLQSAYDANLRRNLWFASEMLRILQHFESKQIQAIPYKGPVLAQTAYNDLALRRFNDLDFLISSVDLDHAKQALAEIGYHPSSDQSAPVERFWLRNGNERMFDGPAGKNLLELQWAILPHFYAIDSSDLRGKDLAVENLIARARRTTVADHQVPSLSAEDNLLVLCLHAAKHLWMRLIWLTDIAETLRSAAPAINHAQALSRATALGILRILGVTFWLIKNLLREELPAWAEETMASDPTVPALGQAFAERLAANATYNFESTEYFRRILKLRERQADRSRYLWRLIWTPGQSDLDVIHLPQPLFPLYRVVRLARLLNKVLLNKTH